MVYLIVGGFAVLAAIGSTDAQDTQGALKQLFHQPLGGVLLAIVGLGLLAFALWRFAQALGDVDNHGLDAKGLLIRFSLFCSGLIHLALAVFAATIVVTLDTSSGGGGSDPTSGWLGWLFGQGWGRWVALALSLVPVGIGIAHIVKGWKAGYDKYLRLDDSASRLVRPICSFGLIARGAIFIVIGILAFYGGGIYDAQSAPGLEDALSYIQDLPFGAILLFVTAIGLVAFAAYCFIEAAFRRIAVEEIVPANDFG
ncbi:hypothetical protein CLD20_01640 [Afifella sp. IM 167]|nr:hypothetical protein [Afifella sp. IM 167]